MPSLLITEESGLTHTLHPSFICDAITSANIILARTGPPFGMDVRGGRGTTGAISKKAGPKRQGKPPGHSPLPRDQKIGTFKNTWPITLSLCGDGMDLAREEFSSCENTGESM